MACFEGSNHPTESGEKLSLSLRQSSLPELLPLNCLFRRSTGEAYLKYESAGIYRDTTQANLYSCPSVGKKKHKQSISFASCQIMQME